MEKTVTVRRVSTGDCMNFPVKSIVKDQIFSEAFLCKRFGLELGDIQRIETNDFPPEVVPVSLLFSPDLDSEKGWVLRGGSSFSLVALSDIVDVQSDVISETKNDLNSEKGKAKVEYVSISDDSEAVEEDIVDKKVDYVQGSGGTSMGPLPKVESLSQDIAPEGKSDETLKIFRISALEHVLAVKGHSEIFRFIKKDEFVVRQVRCLPVSYNGDVIFELPPIDGDAKRGDRVRSMERAKDCYFWTWTIMTSAAVPKSSGKDLWQFGMMKCTGALECRNINCPFFLRSKSRNASAWSGNHKMASLHAVGVPVVDGGLTCGFCDQPPFCSSSCPASMFYMYPAFSLPPTVQRDSMSRLAIHQGIHVHPCRKVYSRDTVQKVVDVIQKHHSGNPSAAPSLLKNIAIGDLLEQFQEGSASGLTDEDQIELWDSIQVISTPHKFMSLLRSVRKDAKEWKGNGIFDCLARMQETQIFPYIQRYRVPGQGSENEFPFIFKMSVKGPGSGVDILRRMGEGEDMFGTWIMFDVMRRITTGWLTFSAHVYDHNYRALCIIFTCELMAENTASCEIAWRQMLDVAREYGVNNIHIQGFMADNAQAGWNAVRNVFFGGVRQPDRERSDAFHWSQSLKRHTAEAIREGKRNEHIALWKRLRDAKNVVEAYRISHEITTWWKQGNGYPGKLKFLQGWLAWWVVRWTQWGNYIRQSITVEESARMLNCTGAESVHSSMRKCMPQRMVGLLEACKMDQNRAAAQIAAFSAYLNGTNRGRGPTIFELAFRAADVLGTPSKFIDATNLWAGSCAEFDLCQTGPLNGDVRTKSQKRKGPASAVISPNDSHRPDTVLLTSPNTRSFRRRNLHSTDFEGMPNSPSHPPTSRARARSSPDPLLRPSRSTISSPPSSSPPPMQRHIIQEIKVPKGTWHLHRTGSGRHKGPMCNGTCDGRSRRADCRNYIKMVGFKADSSQHAVVGIAIDGLSAFRGTTIPTLLWFCPNNLCHRSRPRSCVSPLPAVPRILQVQNGTSLSNAEIHFLSGKGLDFVGRPPISTPQDESFLRIVVDNYPERVELQDIFHRNLFRNGKKIRQRTSIYGEHKKRIERAETETMRVVSEQDIASGNSFGKLFCVRSHEHDDGLDTKDYWVQICCFPTCSCDDFWHHHGFKKSFLLCKHLYWVFWKVFRLDIRTNLRVIQPVLTVHELGAILDTDILRCSLLYQTRSFVSK